MHFMLGRGKMCPTLWEFPNKIGSSEDVAKIHETQGRNTKPGKCF